MFFVLTYVSIVADDYWDFATAPKHDLMAGCPDWGNERISRSMNAARSNGCMATLVTYSWFESGIYSDYSVMLISLPWEISLWHYSFPICQWLLFFRDLSVQNCGLKAQSFKIMIVSVTGVVVCSVWYSLCFAYRKRMSVCHSMCSSFKTESIGWKIWRKNWSKVKFG